MPRTASVALLMMPTVAAISDPNHFCLVIIWGVDIFLLAFHVVIKKTD